MHFPCTNHGERLPAGVLILRSRPGCCLGIFKQPLFLISQLAGVSRRLDLLQLPDAFLVSLLVAVKQFGDADR